MHPDITLITLLARSFTEQIRKRDATALDDWLQDADNCGFRGLRGFSQGIQKDYAAVKAAFTLPWSNGQVEGQVNRLKYLKRQMYGRAKFDLLRLRVLYPDMVDPDT